MGPPTKVNKEQCRIQKKSQKPAVVYTRLQQTSSIANAEKSYPFVSVR